MQDFKTVFLRILFVVILGVLIWQCSVRRHSAETVPTTTAAVTQDLSVDR